MNKEGIRKTFFYAILVLGLILPGGQILASSDMSALWTDKYDQASGWYLPVDPVVLGNFATFLIYFFFGLLILLAITIIFTSRIKMYLAGRNEDGYDAANHSFITSVITLVLAVAVYFSLDFIFVQVRQWIEQMA
jgi:ABC-type Fe3+ transport system permease subunit